MAADPHRLADGGRIDRSRPLRFRFDGRDYQGFAGDTLASALLANGVRIAARSFKYHRPRGIMGAGVEEPAVLVELEGDVASGNRPATTVPLIEGLAARSVNAWPSARLDLGAVNQLFARLIPAGFYYKTFKWPDWHLYEPSIRRLAGLAGAPKEPPERAYESRHAHADILIAGAGPAGLMAALVAGRAGARVFIADEGTEAGGALLNRNLTIGGQPAKDWVAAAVAELAGMENVTHLQNATVWAYREHNLLMVQERAPGNPSLLGRNWRVRAGQAITATGAIERMMVFQGNDRPGVMLASAAQAYVNRWAVRPGSRAVIFTNNDSAYAAAADLAQGGVGIAAIVDSRAAVPDHAMALVPDIAVHAGQAVTSVHGRGRVRGVSIAPCIGGTARRMPCDLLAVSGGWNPAVHLYSQSRSKIVWDKRIASFVPAEPAQAVLAAGAANGAMGLGDALAEGAARAVAALAALGQRSDVPALPETDDTPYTVTPFWTASGAGAKAFLDIQNDVTVADIELALREGYSNIEHLKRYTTGGMGIDQGKTGNVNIIGAVAERQGITPDQVGVTTFRPPYTPVEFGAIAGRRAGPVVLPYRHTPLTRWHKDNGAVMYEAGARWRRPGYYPRAGESFQDTVNREARCVREGVGIYDGAPLGKYEIKGPDAGAFLDWIYTNVMSSLTVGNGRYGLMLTDDGLILDDGVAVCLAPDRFLISTSTGNADPVGQYMEKLLQIERPDWRVKITNVTSQWANATICGPKAREVMAAMGSDIDLSPDAFPFMAFRDGQVADLPARVVRVSFTGELSFEVNVRPRDLPALWEAAMVAGAPFDIAPIGSEANHVLRVEKGFLSLGHEVDGTVDPHDLGMSWVMSRKKDDFVGKRSVELRRASGRSRRELVGIRPLDPNRQVPEGAPLTPGGRKEATEGFVTACVWSVVENRWLGLALLTDGRARIGGRAHVRLPDEVIEVELSDPVFHDPKGERLRS
ncbi:sarcosine oxidase subunit alpha family protein [Defluviimonas sp. WL0050]|uniref:Sarcosine oxidase subunit alpha family protein n=1 Tax=Albidovulum litorale TaxID=2984134 RepID=A0ABT2ZQQ4_9RHOB|nr:sarcosine oxidase subunit alpha family protein [Defluviimonas sp. WL0050]MCV2873497.1 sarcosine oxidase subunit alpha family protein [Defluviimonas sp. WL0050]